LSASCWRRFYRDILPNSLRLTVAIASKFNWDLKQLDIKAAYLNADLEEKIYTKIPYGDKKV